MGINLCWIFLLAGSTATANQAQIIVTAVEGFSRDLYIVCGLGGQVTPLYWNVTGLIFDQFSVPTIFQTDGHRGLRIPTVDRQLDNWTFQCFTIDMTGTLYRSQVTLLRVLYHGAIQPNSIPLLSPSLKGRLLLDYQDLQVGAENTTLRWQYYPDPNAPCEGVSYRVEVYSYQDIMAAESEEELQPLTHVNVTDESITFPFREQYYIRISALNASNSTCARTEYLTGSEFYEPYTSVYTNSFDIPQGSNSLQLIWSKDNNTQCVCPPVEEIISECACNKNNTSNLVTISGSRLTVSNLAEEMDHLMMYFISSETSGCQNRCNVRSIMGIYKIIVQRSPVITHSNLNNLICFNSSIINPYYQVNITTITGLLLRTFNTSQCFDTSDLPVCGLTVSAAVTNSSGEVLGSSKFFTGNGSVHITDRDVTTTTSTATVRLTCSAGYEKSSANLTILRQIDDLNVQTTEVLCNTTKTFHSLLPATEYTIISGNMCPILTFMTDYDMDSEYTSASDSSKERSGLLTCCILVTIALFKMG